MTHDPCGNCVNITLVNSTLYCRLDCANQWYNTSSLSPNIVDECGNCVNRTIVRLPDCVQDCNHTWNGTAYLDQCDQCVVGGVAPLECDQDCAGNYYLNNTTPLYSVDDCGFCSNSSTWDSDKDLCGVCASDPGYNSTLECTPDCKGVYSNLTDPSRAFVDDCGDCWFANQTSMRNINMDDCGNCYIGGSLNSSWNQGYIGDGGPCTRKNFLFYYIFVMRS